MIRLFKHYIPHAVVLLALIDCIVLAGSGELAWVARMSYAGLEAGTFSDRLIPIAVFTAINFLSLIAVGTYTNEALRSPRFAIARMLVALVIGTFALAFFGFLTPSFIFWPSILLYAVALVAFALFVARALFNIFIHGGSFRRRIVVLGAGARAQKLLDLAQDESAGFTVVRCISSSKTEPHAVDAIPREEIADLGEFIDMCRASEIVLALEERRNALPLKDLLRLKTRGVEVYEFSSYIERETGRIDLATVNPSWLIFSDGFSSGRLISTWAKRAFDIAVSAVLLVVSAPIVALFAVLVKIDSAGPAFFRQQRVGLYGENFEVIKLRSMRTDAEKDGAQWASENDPRITRLGRFIRTFRIDELPQAWSVLKGDMSFVGPRPEVPQFVDTLEQDIPFYAERHMVKPGITGWAQINYPYGASVEDARRKLEYDLYYVKNYSPFLDILILLQTLRVILWPQGVR